LELLAGLEPATC